MSIDSVNKSNLTQETKRTDEVTPPPPPPPPPPVVAPTEAPATKEAVDPAVQNDKRVLQANNPQAATLRTQANAQLDAPKKDLPPPPRIDPNSVSPTTNASTTTAPPGPTPSGPPPPLTAPQMKDRDASLKVDGAVKNLESAKSKVEEADRRLAETMTRLNPALTDDQRSAVVKSYREQNKETYDAEAKAATDLKTALTDPALANNDAKLKEGYTALAKSPQAETALDWASTRAKDKGADPKLAEIAATAAATAAPSIISKAPTALDGVKNIEDKLEPFIKASEGAKAGFEGIKGIQDALKNAKEMASGKFDNVKELAKDWKSKGPLAKSLSVIGVVAGAANGANDVKNGDYVKAVKDLAEAGKGGIEILASVSHAFKDSSKFAASTEKFAKTAAKWLPALGAAVSAASLTQRVNEKEKDAGTYLGMLGDSLSVAGSVLEATPLAPAGGVLNGAGMIISGAGDLTSGLINMNRNIENEKKMMAAANVQLEKDKKAQIPQSTIDNMAGRLQANTEPLARFGMTPEQVQKAIEKYPRHIDTDPNSVETMVAAAKAEHVTPDGFLAFMDRYINDPKYRPHEMVH